MHKTEISTARRKALVVDASSDDGGGEGSMGGGGTDYASSNIVDNGEYLADNQMEAQINTEITLLKSHSRVQAPPGSKY